jgi:uncharacterized membrane protein
MNSQPVMLILRLLHIVSGVLWVGGAAVLAGFVLPAARDQDSLDYLRQLIWKRNLPRYLNVTLALAILSGLTMYGNLVVATDGAWAWSHVGLALGVGGALAIIAAIIATFVAAPAIHRALQLSSQSQTTNVPREPAQQLAVDRALARYAAAMRLVVVLLLGTAALMAMARYL